MRIDKLVHAITEARRFVNIAEKAYDKIQRDSLTTMTGSKETSATRRASMDLTRSLAELRKPN